MNPESEFVDYIDSRRALAEAIPALEDAEVLGVDTESDSMHCYFEKVCFIQIKAGDRTYIVDTIELRDLDPLVEVFNDPRSLKILHGADYDVSCLARDFDVQFGQLYDTMLAAQYLGRPSLGLAALCEEHFGVQMDKSLTRHNWALRPLEDRYLEYIAADVRHLAELKNILHDEVLDADLWPELDNEFERLRQLPFAERPFDEEGYRKIKGARNLDRKALPALKALYLCRDELARERDLPPFKVMNNQTMVELAERRPRRIDEIDLRHGARSKFAKRYGRDVMDALDAAEQGEVRIEVPRKKKRDGESGLRFQTGEALRKWRQEKAAERKLPSTAILPKHLMTALAERLPKNWDDLEDIPFFGDRRLDQYGDELLDLIEDQRAT